MAKGDADRLTDANVRAHSPGCRDRAAENGQIMKKRILKEKEKEVLRQERMKKRLLQPASMAGARK